MQYYTKYNSRHYSDVCTVIRLKRESRDSEDMIHFQTPLNMDLHITSTPDKERLKVKGSDYSTGSSKSRHGKESEVADAAPETV